ncbi:MAG: LacI family transcriptional regulator [Burkholderiales bacterium]|nr:LacI family transcriptional regulator [Burkholderiales bacterium]
MTFPARALATTALFLMLVTSAFDAAPAQQFPDRPVRLIVPYPAGGPNDVLARMLGSKLTEAWGEQVVIDNRAGAGGNLAVQLAARAQPDGYTLILPAMAYAVNPSLYSKVPYSFDQFIPITIVAKGPLVLVVHPALGANTVQSLLKLSRAKPGQINYASGGTGSSPHLAGELFKVAAGIDLVHVPYKGTNDVIPDLLSGRVPVFFASPLVAREHVKAGRLRAIGVTSLKRATGWPEVPSINEAGVKDYEMEAWYAVLVQAKTPGAIVRSLHQHIEKALRSRDVQQPRPRSGRALRSSPTFAPIRMKRHTRLRMAAPRE